MEKIIYKYYPIEYDFKYNSDKHMLVFSYSITPSVCMGGNRTNNQISPTWDDIFGGWNNKTISET